MAADFIGHAEHGHVLDGGIAVEIFLDLPRVDVFAAADDHVALAVDQPDVAVGIAARHVTHRAPRAVKRLGGFLRVLPVAVEHIRGAREQLAHFAVGHFAALLD